MKLRNKKTGEIIEVLAKISFIKRNDNFIDSEVNTFNSLATLNEEWEDYQEPKKYWFIDAYGNIVQNEITQHYGDEYTDMTDAYETQKQIGNYFETEEEAERTVEKLKAWKRLKDEGFRFKTYMRNPTGTYDCFAIWEDNIPPSSSDIAKDLNLLFGGEE